MPNEDRRRGCRSSATGICLQHPCRRQLIVELQLRLEHIVIDWVIPLIPEIVIHLELEIVIPHVDIQADQCLIQAIDDIASGWVESIGLLITRGDFIAPRRTRSICTGDGSAGIPLGHTSHPLIDLQGQRANLPGTSQTRLGPPMVRD